MSTYQYIYLSFFGNKIGPNSIGLYRNDGLAVFKNASGPQSGNTKKNFHKKFKIKSSDIIIKCKMTIVNYLDVTLNLNNESYRPYDKTMKQFTYMEILTRAIHFKTT